MGPPAVVVSDFNHTLVREGALPAWCRSRLAGGPVRLRLRALLDIVLLGTAARLLDAVGLDVAAARVGLLAFRGASPEEVRRWAAAGLTPNPRALDLLEGAGLGRGGVRLVVVSRGTPRIAVAAWLERAGLSAAEILAPDLDVREGRLTGRVVGGLLAKTGRAALVPDGGIFLGDRGDRRWARREAGRIRFVQI